MNSEGKIKLIEIIADSGLGGGPKHVLGLLKNIDKEQFDVSLICPGGYLSAEAKQIKGVNVYNVEIKSKFDLIALNNLKKTIDEIRSRKDPFGPLIIHTHGSRAGFLGRLAAPIFAKKVHTEHIFDQNYHLTNPINEWIQKTLLRAQNNRSDLVIAVSSSVKNFLISQKMAPEERIRVIPNGITLQVTSYKLLATQKNTKAPIIGTVGNLNYQKGQTYLIDAMPIVIKKYPLATLEIIGEGEERKILEAEVKKLKLEKHVALLGHKNIIEKCMRHWEVFAFPSISETFGIAVLEAMNFGLPVVASKVGGIPDIITHRKNGILVEPKNEKALAQAILDVLDHPAIAAKYKREGRGRLKDFDWSKLIEKIENEFLNLFEANQIK